MRHAEKTKSAVIPVPAITSAGGSSSQSGRSTTIAGQTFSHHVPLEIIEEGDRLDKIVVTVIGTTMRGTARGKRRLSFRARPRATSPARRELCEPLRNSVGGDHHRNGSLMGVAVVFV
jgi:hypothetical protein